MVWLKNQGVLHREETHTKLIILINKDFISLKIIKPSQICLVELFF